MHLVGISCFGFGLGGLLVFLGGLIAIDICSKKATGAAMGLVGLFSYIATAIQERVSGKLIQAGEMVQNGQKVHDFTYAYGFWLGAAIVSMLLACCVWNAKARD
jgi:OPA family sugar phosphate sensor protein UhpC-like MFS transporter